MDNNRFELNSELMISVTKNNNDYKSKNISITELQKAINRTINES